jgi:hypothetical protein
VSDFRFCSIFRSPLPFDSFSTQTGNAQTSDSVVRISVRNDQPSIYADFGGQGPSSQLA